MSTSPECPFCKVGHLIAFGVVIVCAYCRKAWLDYEFETDLHNLRAKESAS